MMANTNNKKDNNFDAMNEEKSRLKCIVCHEGYTLNPNKLLGVYIYSKAQKIPDEKSILNHRITYIIYLIIIYNKKKLLL
jgi:hypothetical protein